MSEYNNDSVGFATSLGHGQSVKAATHSVANSQSIAHTYSKPNSLHGVQTEGQATQTQATQTQGTQNQATQTNGYTPEGHTRAAALSGAHGTGTGHSSGHGGR